MKVTISTTSGDITLELYEDKAPNTVKNFLEYVESGFYEDTIFHRVINDFMIQGGGLNKDLNNKTTNAPIDNEANNDLSNQQGTVAMARTSAPHSATAQFFINTTDNRFLDFQNESDEGWGYCVFGKVVDGMETVFKIEEAPTTIRNGYQDVPEEDIVIEKITVKED